MTGLLVALGAGFGACVRWSLARHLDGSRPWGTLAANVAGSTLVGAFAALSLSGHAWALLAVGGCGGLTTYSGFAVGVHDLGWRRGSLYAAATLVLSVAGCAVAFRLM